jgi:tetratricopeptide (TPR) repeat protein
MKSRLARYLLFAIVGAIVALCFAIKPLVGFIAVLFLVALYAWRMQSIYQRLANRQQRPDGMEDKELQPAQVYYRRACKRWEQGEHAGAMSDFELAIADELCFAEVYYQYGMLLLETGNAIDAMVRLEQAINCANRDREPNMQVQATTTLNRLRHKFPQVARL